MHGTGIMLCQSPISFHIILGVSLSNDRQDCGVYYVWAAIQER